SAFTAIAPCSRAGCLASKVGAPRIFSNRWAPEWRLAVRSAAQGRPRGARRELALPAGLRDAADLLVRRLRRALQILPVEARSHRSALPGHGAGGHPPHGALTGVALLLPLGGARGGRHLGAAARRRQLSLLQARRPAGGSPPGLVRAHEPLGRRAPLAPGGVELRLPVVALGDVLRP